MCKKPKCKASRKRVKITKQKLRVTNGRDCKFAIGGFEANRICEFEVDSMNYEVL